MGVLPQEEAGEINDASQALHLAYSIRYGGGFGPKTQYAALPAAQRGLAKYGGSSAAGAGALPA